MSEARADAVPAGFQAGRVNGAGARLGPAHRAPLFPILIVAAICLAMVVRRWRRLAAVSLRGAANDGPYIVVELLLGDLIGVARQGTKAIRQAGLSMKDERLESMLRDIAMERGHTAALLQGVLRTHRLPDVHGHQPTGDVVPEWRRVQRLAASGDTEGILAAVAAGEDATLDRFRQALRCPLPDDVRFVVAERLFEDIQPSRHRLVTLSATFT